MRPLVAHRHLGLGKLYRRDQAKTQEHPGELQLRLVGTCDACPLLVDDDYVREVPA